MAKPATTFRIKGPLFKSDAKVSQGFKDVVDRGLLDLATLEGANKIREQLWGPTSASAYKISEPSQRHGAKTRTLRRSIGATVKDGIATIGAGSQHGRKNLIYAAWVEGISSRNQASSFKGYQMFEKTYEHIESNPTLYEEYIGASLVEEFD